MSTIDKKYISVKEFAAAAGVSTQYVYKILDTHLKPYKKRFNNKTCIDTIAIDLVKNKFNNSTTDATAEILDLQPTNSTLQPTNSTNSKESVANSSDLQPTCNQDATAETLDLQPKQPTNSNKVANDGEIEALKELVKELKQDKEELLKDKEYLKQEAMKWQQLLADERNKVKLLEAAAASDKPIEEAIVEEATIKEENQEKPKTFFEKLKWLFNN